MTINVLFFADLREKLNKNQVDIEYKPALTVLDAWYHASDGYPLPKNLLCARNQAMCSLDDSLKPGDELAFFPPVSGG